MYWVGRWEGGSLLVGSGEGRSVLDGSLGGKVCTEWVVGR